ncbi:DegV family protein [Paratractidigestivibacter sp.]|uniref:DegV family protein n=1 Tax=Paratractidigestivibacter sp. TaxID=2847316 RepID=UPI002ABD3064|nr:DegV family protein [Paratractidigestivibacter sp.]
MSNNSFAIICDSTCGLPSELLTRLEVVCVPLHVQAGGRAWLDGEDNATAAEAIAAAGADVIVGRPDSAELLSVYQCLADDGYDKIAVVCSSLEATGIWSEAEQAVAELQNPGVRIRTVDTGVAAVATAMVIERLASARAAGVDFDDAVDRARALSREVRFLYIPESSAPFVQRAFRRRRRGLLARAASLRLRLAGERSLYLLRGGEYTALARSTDMTDLCGRVAHAMSSVACGSGELVYAVMEGTSAQAVRAIEKPLDTNEFCSLFLGHASASPSIMASIGPEAVGVGFAPKDLYLAAGADGPLINQQASKY